MPKQAHIKFSIIIPVFNAKESLQDCINSVNNQSYKEKELIIMDGGSTDGTINILNANNEKIQYWDSATDRGISHAWNKALDRISGNWVYFLGADDNIYNNSILEIVAHEIAVKSLFDYDLVCGSVAYQDKTKNSSQIYESNVNAFPDRMFPHQGIFHNNRLFANGNRFSEYFKIAADYDFLVSAWKNKGLRIYTFPAVIAKCRTGGISNSAKEKLRAFREIFEIRKKFGLQLYSPEMILFFFKANVKYLLRDIL